MTLEDYFRRAEYTLEVTSFERHALWKEYHDKYTWEENLSGFGRKRL